VVLEAPALPAERDLPPGTQAALFRIAQEALSNVARHARARRVTVHLGSANGPWAAELSIADDGAGFDPASIAAGRGLANLRARARELGAELRVDSAPGRGTRIGVRVPMASGSWTSAPAALQRGLLLGLAVLFHLGFAGRPVLGEWVFWSLLPFSTAAGWLAFRLLRATGRALAEAVRRLGADGDEVLRLRRQRAQAGFLLVLSACAWNPLFSTVALSYLGYPSAAGIPRLPAAVLTLVIAASLLPLQRALARLRARLSAGAFRDELAAALDESTLPVVLLIGGVGLFGRFLHEWTVALLPVGLGLWLASLGSWALRSWPAARPDAGTDRG